MFTLLRNLRLSISASLAMVHNNIDISIKNHKIAETNNVHASKRFEIINLEKILTSDCG